MQLLLHALSLCVFAYNNALVSLIFGIVIPTFFNILMELSYTCFTDSLKKKKKKKKKEKMEKSGF